MYTVPYIYGQGNKEKVRNPKCLDDQYYMEAKVLKMPGETKVFIILTFLPYNLNHSSSNSL